MEAVRYLDSLERRPHHGIGVLTAAVSADQLHAGMLREPVHDRF